MLHESITAAVTKASRRWDGTRAKKSQESQMLQALKTLLAVLYGCNSALPNRLEDVPTEIVQEVVEQWKKDGKSTSTICVRLSILSIMGIKTNGCWVKNKSSPKWCLTSEDQDRLMAYLRNEDSPFANAPLLADYIEFISFTGLRVEEALRLTWRDVSLRITEDSPGVLLSQSEMTAPGTKTERARARLPLGLLPTLLLSRIQETSESEFVFPIRYEQLHEAWDKARTYLGEHKNRMATLKALRRSAAHHLTVNGMPTDMVRRYLRHSNIKTTLGYLDVVGGYNLNEMRKFLS